MLHRTQYRDNEGFVHNYSKPDKRRNPFKKVEVIIGYRVIVTEKNKQNPMYAFFHTKAEANHFATYYRSKGKIMKGYKVKIEKVK